MKIWLLVIVFIAAVVIYLGLVILGGKPSYAPGNYSEVQNSQFSGPREIPHVKGPSGPPPGAN